MICLDTSSLIAYLEGEPGNDVEAVDQALRDRAGYIAPVTLSELLSEPTLSRSLRDTMLGFPLLPLFAGYWERAGLLRAKVLRSGHKAKLADTLIAQTCLDYRATLIARDRDFLAFHRVADLKLHGHKQP